MLPIQRFINAAMQQGIENQTFEKVYELKLGHRILSVNLTCPHLLYIVHTFHNLTQIEVFFHGYKGKIWRGKWRWMLEVLQQRPKLEHLAIHQSAQEAQTSTKIIQKRHIKLSNLFSFKRTPSNNLFVDFTKNSPSFGSHPHRSSYSDHHPPPPTPLNYSKVFPPNK
ncbi:hypothetical protein MTR_1g043180 [Medicago truncatula]|uniref:Uncharacterized protein n=1 Tax=Medicago truncatula TaxID=3880 RepID=G7I4R0_MEDTR|nr:hypothetical protein MTR_1g043180 [Medicago truncatula]